MYNTVSPARLKYKSMTNLESVRIQFSNRSALKEKFSLLGYDNVDFSARVKNLESLFINENKKSPEKPPIPSLVIAGSGSILHRKIPYESHDNLTILILDNLKSYELEKSMLGGNPERSTYIAFSYLWKELCNRTGFLDGAEENNDGFKLLNMKVESSPLYSCQIMLSPVTEDSMSVYNSSNELDVILKSKNFK